MSDTSKKMQLRAEIVSLLNKYRGASLLYQKVLIKDIETLKNIPDKETLAKTLYKELIHADESYSKKCGLFILECLDEDTIFNYTCKYLVDKNLSDDIKFYIVSIAKQKGLTINQTDVQQNITSCKDIAKKSINNFLKNANLDPEVQIDFLDFYINISQKERLSLLENIIDESEDDVIINIFTLLLKTKIEKAEFEIIENYFLNILKTYTSSALEGLNVILNIEDDKIKKSQIQKLIKKIKFKDKTIPKCNFIKNSTIDKCCVGFVDGQNEFSLAFSRKKDDDNYTLSMFTINTQIGITSSIGFGSINKDGINSILKRVYYMYPPIPVSPVALKSIYENYRTKNIASNTIIPYEALVWEKMLSDIRIINFRFDDFIVSKLEQVEITKKRFESIKNSDILESWFYSYNQNECFDKIVDLIEEQGKNQDFSIENIEKIIINNISQNITQKKAYIKNLKENIILQSYIAKQGRRIISSGVLYGIYLDKTFLARLILHIFKKSIYQYFLNKKKSFCNNESTILFKLSKNKSLNKSDVEKIINSIEEKWKLKSEL